MTITSEQQLADHRDLMKTRIVLASTIAAQSLKPYKIELNHRLVQFKDSENLHRVEFTYSIKNHALEASSKTIDMHLHTRLGMGYIRHSFSGIGKRTDYLFTKDAAKVTARKIVKLIRAEHGYWKESLDTEAVKTAKAKAKAHRLMVNFPEEAAAGTIYLEYGSAKIKTGKYRILAHEGGFSISATTGLESADRIKAITAAINDTTPAAPEPVEKSRAMKNVDKIAKVEGLSAESVIEVILRNTSVADVFDMIEAETKINSVG